MNPGAPPDTIQEGLQPGLHPGLSGREEIEIGDAHLTRHVGGRGVFATPAMIWLMENVAHGSVAPLLDPAQTTVGYEVHVRHLAPADPGERIVVTSRLVEVRGNRLAFEVEARRGDTVIGNGLHRRAVVSTRS